MSRFELYLRRIGLCRIGLYGALLGVNACNWTEFDRFEDEAPVVVLNRAKDSTGFGRSVSAAADKDLAVVLVGGAPSRSLSAAYSLGFDQDPVTGPAQLGYCSRDNPRLTFCLTADQGAFFPMENSSERDDLCFAHAWGGIPDDLASDRKETGVLVRCFRDGADVKLRVPSTARSRHKTAYDVNKQNQPLWLASDRGAKPWLLAALENQRMAWFYLPNQRIPRTLTRPSSAGVSFGRRVAVARLSDETAGPRLLVLSAPAEGQVWLYRAEKTGNEASAVLVGCLGEYDEFGRALATGRVDKDDVDDLVVADKNTVTVFSGAALAELPEAFAETCSLNALPEGAVLGSFGCGSRLGLSGCSSSDFGASLVVADLDGDGDGEVVVGAPEMVVHGQEHAGALLVYDVEGRNPHQLADVFYVSSAEAGDQMGTSVAALSQKGRDVIIGGGPGNSKVAVFYCSSLLKAKDRTLRCVE